MENRWDDHAADECVNRYAAQGVSEALALRVYTSRLIGGDPALVLHGGGNTSAKDRAVDVTGREIDVLYVKGSGWDLAAIEPAGFPGVRLEALRALRTVSDLTDAQMMNALRTMLLDAAAPNPSVEALLHGFLPHRFVDHTHANAILALVDQPEAEARCRDVFGDCLAVLPWVFPGFPLAGIAADAYDQNPHVDGIVLLNHGLFTFGESAKESYDRMIHYVDVAEQSLAKTGPRIFMPRTDLGAGETDPAECLPMLRGALAQAADVAPGGYKRVVLHFRTGEGIRQFVDGRDLAEYACRGVATPDHIIRTKNAPLIVPPYDRAAPGAWAAACRDAVAAFHGAYRSYFEAGCTHTGQNKVMLDPTPRVILVPGLGMVTAAPTEKAAKEAADIYEHTMTIIGAAEGFGRYTPLDALELFGMEYWSLEQAKLGKGKEAPFARHVVFVTGAASGIGLATAQAFAAQGANVVVTDLDAQALDAAAQGIAGLGGSATPIVCDVTRAVAVQEAFAATTRRFGGVDIVVSNAGRVWQGPVGAVSDSDLRESFELNFFAHQSVAQAAIEVFQRQGTGGVLLFNASKSAFNPGPGMGPYTLPKAAVVALMKQYAVEYGADGIRCNAINADRVPTNLFGDGVLEARAKARGVSVDTYLSGNLLGKVVRPDDVAEAFVALARAERTTGAVLPVDGGNIAAAPR